MKPTHCKSKRVQDPSVCITPQMLFFSGRNSLLGTKDRSACARAYPRGPQSGEAFLVFHHAGISWPNHGISWPNHGPTL